MTKRLRNRTDFTSRIRRWHLEQFLAWWRARPVTTETWSVER
jgi:hypothetical protein